MSVTDCCAYYLGCTTGSLLERVASGLRCISAVKVLEELQGPRGRSLQRTFRAVLKWGTRAQVNIPLWALVHFPVIVTITTAMFTPKARSSFCLRRDRWYPRSSPCPCWMRACTWVCACMPGQC